MILKAEKAAFLTLKVVFKRYSLKIEKQAEIYLKTTFPRTSEDEARLSMT